MKVGKGTINPKKAEAGRKGGLATLEKHGRQKLAAWGKTGGRPKENTEVT